VLHLLYSRFFNRVLSDLGLVTAREPFTNLLTQGMVIKDGAKMSKSKGNIINPDEYIAKYGADAIRMYLRFLGPFDQGGDWRDDGMQGMYRFINKIWKLYQELGSLDSSKMDEAGLLSKANPILHRTIKGVGEDLDNLKFNTAIAKIMQFVNWYIENKDKNEIELNWFYLKNFSLILAPIIPYITEEFWQIMGGEGSVHLQKWPKYLDGKIHEVNLNIPVQVNGKIRGVIDVQVDTDDNELQKIAKSNENVQKYLEGKTIVKVIIIKNKIINFLIK